MNKLYYLASFFLFALVLIPFSTEAKTTVDVGNDGTVQVTVNMMLHGPGATDALAKKWSEWTEDGWNAEAQRSSCFKMNFTANIENSGTDSAIDGLEEGGIRTHRAIVGSEQPDFGGWTSIYVPEATPGGWYRSWISDLGTYDKDGFGAIYEGVDEETVVHEVGHIMGMDDHYNELESGVTYPEQCWTNNIMGQFTDKYTLSYAQTNEGVASDPRNFEEMIKSIEDQTDLDFRSCYRIEERIDVTYNNLPANTDDFNSTVWYNVRPKLPVLTDENRYSDDAYLLEGEGTGNGVWTPRERGETDFIRFEITNNDFENWVTGTIDGDTWYIVMTPRDNTRSISSSGEYDVDSTINYIRPGASGQCTMRNDSMSVFKLDTRNAAAADFSGCSYESVEGLDVLSGTSCDFRIDGAQGVYSGWMNLFIRSIQG